MSAPHAVVSVQDVSFSFGEGSVRKQILFGVSLELMAGEIVLLTGPSGSGKTTLLTLIGALRRVQEGSIRVLGTELCGSSARTLTETRRKLGFIFQAHNLHRSLTAQANVRMGLEVHPELDSATMDREAAEALNHVGLKEQARQLPAQLSGGQKQRVAIARALAGKPRLLLADEPTAALDSKAGREVVELMQRLAREQQTTILMVTHDNRILDVADRILDMEDGRLVRVRAPGREPVDQAEGFNAELRAATEGTAR